ncbi:MAG: hypothetical protein FP824_03340 [Euryarchaeota archaeon]|nr:hypothetical protein [Euryarchaeota archaeon]MBU4070554.1 hypothetical protein [Candidatus Thermoplasmatota archaeon]MBU4145106.1 hypothetical protein [Candidatus Thermoplasmatota archaeon]
MRDSRLLGVAAVLIILAIILAGAGLAEGKARGGIARVPPTPIQPTVFEIMDLLATPHAPTATDVQLEWSEISGATEYRIYRSTSVRGDGFNYSSPYDVVPATGTGKIIWTDVGAYATASDYAWVVTSVFGTTENLDISNIAWKKCITLRQGMGSAGMDQNYISLPYRVNITYSTHTNNAAALIGDMRTYGTPINGISSVNRWDSNNSMWQARTSFAGTNFVLKPGEGYRAVVTLPVVIYKMVGAYDPDYIHLLFKGTGVAGADNNYISLPYHYAFTANTAAYLISNIRGTGTPINAVSSVNRWNQDTSMWEARVMIAGTNFNLMPGECYRLVLSTASEMTWTCPVATLGV